MAKLCLWTSVTPNTMSTLSTLFPLKNAFSIREYAVTGRKFEDEAATVHY